ncbi:histone-like nucleoid-structuring protein, MvaT/MvaU family [Azotobacter beijerinckii]|uniref:H-NS histone family protein n=1 Tax=Azotobacter beijerinckii TaxID=170623 RepID=A0A1I4GHD2_9GAMM|nr:histone-like nucleoid-structuring protein, MvaT/MvaU family [Azotobacter beijerinckii]SFL28920.1 H-NS histone family protein [Azotobacter beijerinckii]
MSKILEFRATEEAIIELQAKLDALKGNQGLQEELEFEQKLRQLMQEHGKTLRDINAILDPQPFKRETSTAQHKAKQTRRSRETKHYRNPYTNEVVVTKGGNHRTLKAWKEEFGAATVNTWLEAEQPEPVAHAG